MDLLKENIFPQVSLTYDTQAQNVFLNDLKNKQTVILSLSTNKTTYQIIAMTWINLERLRDLLDS